MEELKKVKKKFWGKSTYRGVVRMFKISAAVGKRNHKKDYMSWWKEAAFAIKPSRLCAEIFWMRRHQVPIEQCEQLDFLETRHIRNPFLMLDNMDYTLARALHGSDVHSVTKSEDTITTELQSCNLADCFIDRGAHCSMVLCMLLLFLRSLDLCRFVLQQCEARAPLTEGDIFEILGAHQRLLNPRKAFVPARTMRNGKKAKKNTDASGYTISDVSGMVSAWLFRYESDGRTSESQLSEMMIDSPAWRGHKLMLPHLVASFQVLGRLTSETLDSFQKGGIRSQLAFRFFWPKMKQQEVFSLIRKQLQTLPFDNQMSDNEITTGLCKILQILRNFCSTHGLNNWRHETTPEVVDEWKRLL